MSKYPNYANAVAQPIDLGNAVRQYRANESAARRLTSARGLHSRQKRAEAYRLALTLAGHVDLAEMLTREATLSWLLARGPMDISRTEEFKTERRELKVKILDYYQAR